MKSERGSALVENCIVMLVLVSVLSTALALAYVAFARTWLEESGDETLICLASEVSQTQCETEFRSRVAEALKIGSLVAVRLSKSSSSVKINYRFRVSDEFTFNSARAAVLPLEARR